MNSAEFRGAVWGGGYRDEKQLSLPVWRRTSR